MATDAMALSKNLLRELANIAFADALKVESDAEAAYLMTLMTRLEKAADDAEERECAA